MTETIAPWDVARPTPQPSQVVASAPPPQQSDAAARALAIEGQAWREVAAETDRYGLHLETIQAQDALNQLRSRKDELTYGDQGFMQVKGGDVIRKDRPGGPLISDYRSKFQAVSDDLASKLGPRGRMMFNQRAAAEMAGFSSDILKHSIQQTEFYNVAVDKDTQQQALAQAARFADDPSKLAEQAERAKLSAERLAASQGRPTEGVGLAAQSNVLRVGIETRLAKNDGRGALAYFDAVKDKLDGPDRAALEAKMKSTETDIGGDTAAAAALGLTIPAAVKQYDPLIQKAAADTGVRPALITGVMSQESGGRETDASGRPLTSSAGAGGLMQIMPGTARDLGVTNVHDPNQAVPAGARYLKQQLDKYNGNERLALMAYNWGPGHVDNWLKTGADPEKIPRETRDYVQRVQGYALSAGSIKPDAAAAKLELMGNPYLPPAVKANALAKIEKTTAALEAFRTSSIKTLDDKVESVIASVIASPGSLQDGTFQAISDQYRALGRPDEATRYALLASMEGTLKQGLGAASDAQLEIMKGLFKGLPQQLLSGIMSGNSKARTEAAALGAEKFAQIKKSVETDGVKPTGMVAVAKEAIEHFAQAGKPEEARKVSDFMTSAFDADKAASGPSVEADQARADLADHANKGLATAQQLQTLSLVGQMVGRQKTLLAQDAFKNGATIYARDVGPIEPIDFTNPESVWQALDIRSNQARKIAQLSGNETIPFTGEEIERFRTVLDKGAPEAKANLLKTLARAIPDDMKTGVAVALSGKKGDDTSHAYAAALANYGSGDPAQASVADKILMGAQIMRNGGEGGRKAAETSDAWLSEMQGKIGNALALHLGGKVPAELAAAIKAHYVASMWAAGKQGDKTDTSVLDRSIDAVTGGIINFRGQNMFAPSLGATSYDIDSALRSLTPADIPANLRTQEGDQITADAIKRDARLMSVGSGTYAVRIPDPRAGGDLRPIVDPNTGKAFVLDLRPLLERAKDMPPAIPLQVFNP